MNPGEFDRAGYDRRQRLVAMMHVLHPYQVEVVAGRSISPLANLRAAGRAVLEKGFSPARAVDRALLTALVLGDREQPLRDVEDQFTRSGTAHLLAGNGTRIAVLAMFLYVICQVLCLRPRVGVLVVTVAVALYGLATSPSPQAIRPALLCAAVGAGLAGRRTVDSVQLLALTAIVILLANPLELYSAGFQLSFVTVLGLMLLAPPALRWMRRFEDEDQRVLASFGRQSVLRRLAHQAQKHFVRIVVAASVAWLVSWPLVAWHFEQVNPWCVPAGIALSPFAFLAQSAGILKLIFTAIVPPLAPAWAAMAALPACWLRWGVGWAARLPACDIPLTRPPIWAIAAYYLLLIAPLAQLPPPADPMVPAHAARWRRECSSCSCRASSALPGRALTAAKSSSRYCRSGPANAPSSSRRMGA